MPLRCLSIVFYHLIDRRADRYRQIISRHQKKIRTPLMFSAPVGEDGDKLTGRPFYYFEKRRRAPTLCVTRSSQNDYANDNSFFAAGRIFVKLAKGSLQSLILLTGSKRRRRPASRTNIKADMIVGPNQSFISSFLMLADLIYDAMDYPR
jgi:hypothetical protein